MFSQELYREVKRKLRHGYKGNPEVRFELKIDVDVYDIVCLYGIDSKTRGTKFVIGLQNNRDFDCYLGKGWDRRIINKQGDFVYVANGSVRFYVIVFTMLLWKVIFATQMLSGEVFQREKSKLSKDCRIEPI